MAAAVVTTHEVVHGKIHKLVFDWASATAGTATQASTEVYDGRIMLVVQEPSADPQPTALFDITITDKNGNDVLEGKGANLANDAVTRKWDFDGLGAACGTILTFNLAAAGAEKEGLTTVYIQ